MLNRTRGLTYTCLSIGLGLLLASCAQVLGIEDTHVDNTAGAGGAGGTCPDDQGSAGAPSTGTSDVTACSMVLDEICANTSAPAAGPYADPRWACVGMGGVPAEKPPVAPAEATFAVGKLVDFTTRRAVAGVTVKSCPTRNDPTCAGPYDTAVTDPDGAAKVKIPVGDGGFKGFILFEGCTYLPVLFNVSQPLYGDFPLEGYSLFPRSIFSQTYLLDDLGGNPWAFQPGRGNIDVLALGCDGKPAPGVSLVFDDSACSGSRLDCQTAAFYVSDMGAPNSKLQETTTSGEGGLFNVKPGLVHLGAIVNALEPKDNVVAASLELTLRPDALTTVLLFPNR